MKSTIYLHGISQSCLGNLLSVKRFDQQSSNINYVILFITNKDINRTRTITILFETARQLTYILTNLSLIISSSCAVTECIDEGTNHTFINKASKVTPEYLLEGTIFRRVTNPTGCRYWLIHIHNMIEDYSRNYQAYFDKMENNIPIHSPLQVHSYNVFKFSRVCGYKLSDGSLGFSFRDKTNLILLSDSEQMYYINCYGRIFHFEDRVSVSSRLQGKLIYLSLFKPTTDICSEEKMSRGPYDMPFLVKWFKGGDYTVMYFSNGTLEILFLTGRKIIFSPFMKPTSISERGKSGSVSPIDLQIASYISKRLFQNWSLSYSRLPRNIFEFSKTVV